MTPAENSICVIIPCYRSAAYLRKTVSGIQAALRCGAHDPRERRSHRIILINDGSPDETWDVIASLCAEDPSVIGIDLAANAGQANARLAAVPYLSGRCAVFMDDDGQHPADQICPMISRLKEGWHMVYAQFPRLEESPRRRFFSFLNNLYVSCLTRKPLRLRITSFFVLDETGIRILRESPHASFIGGAVLRKTNRVTGFPVDHQPRKTGTSNYTLKRLLKHWSAITGSILFPQKALLPAPVIREVLNAPSGPETSVRA